MLGGFFLTETYLGGLRTVEIPSTAFQILIDGIDRAGMLKHQSLRIQDELEVRNICDFALVDSSDSLDLDLGLSVIILDQGTRIFAGTIDRVRDVYPSSNSSITDHLIECTCVDFNQIADRHEVASVYETANQTAGDIVKSIRETYLADDGIVDGDIQDGLTVGKVLFDYNKVTDALDELASLVGFAWNIDYYNQLHFFDATTFSAPFNISDSSQNHVTVIRERGREHYRNVQRVRAGRDITESTRDETFLGDGNTRTFTVSRPIAKEPTIVKNPGSVSQTVGIQDVETEQQWYWNKGSKEVTQDDDETVLSSSQSITVTYYGFFDILVEVRDDAAVQARRTIEGGSGVYEALVDDKKIDNETVEYASQLAVQKAQGLLRQFARIPIEAEVVTDVAGLRAGHIQTINLTREKLDGNYLIVSVEISDRGFNQLRYHYRVVDGDKLESPYKFFLKLAKAGREFVIRENEVLLIVREVTSGLGLTDADNSSTGNNLLSFSSDPYTVFVVGEAIIGREYTDETGAVIGRGGFYVGDMTNK